MEVKGILHNTVLWNVNLQERNVKPADSLEYKKLSAAQIQAAQAWRHVTNLN